MIVFFIFYLLFFKKLTDNDINKKIASLTLLLFINASIPFALGLEYSKYIFKFKIYYLTTLLYGFGAIYWTLKIICRKDNLFRCIASCLFFPYMFLINKVVFSVPTGKVEYIISVISLFFAIFSILYFVKPKS